MATINVTESYSPSESLRLMPIAVIESYSPSASIRLMPISVAKGYLYIKTSILQWSRAPLTPSRFLSPSAFPSVSRLKKPEREALSTGIASETLRLMPITSSESLPFTESTSVTVA